MRIKFLNVGQGDSIILNWSGSDDDLNKIGVIDCKIHCGKNPVLEDIKVNKYTEIEFVVLSHPHYDHYSGLPALFEYCFRNEIKINYFVHTCQYLRDYIKTALNTAEAQKSLTAVFKNAMKLRDEKETEVGYVNSSPSPVFHLDEGIELTFLSPSSKEYENYIKKEKFYSKEESPHHNPEANWLSTIIKISNKDSYVLLTSDAEKKSLIRIDKKSNNGIQGELQLAQSPHHGAFTNHNNAFWRKRRKNKNTPIVFSVGENQYNHPSKVVIDFFRRNEYKIHSTNLVGGLLSHWSEESSQNQILLSAISSPASQTNGPYNGDQEFKVF